VIQGEILVRRQYELEERTPSLCSAQCGRVSVYMCNHYVYGVRDWLASLVCRTTRVLSLESVFWQLLGRIGQVMRERDARWKKHMSLGVFDTCR
jgi:hypothetical protein